MSRITVHTVAQTGFGTGTNELYDKARPSYQAAALSYIHQSLKSASPLNIVELGSGTGIFTRALLAHPDWSSGIGQLKAIEPSEGMRNTFSNTIQDERVTTAEGTFDRTGVEDGWADLVVIAQAFHWCPDYDKASAEFARILKRSGTVAFIWNLEDREGARWVAQLRDTYEEFEKGAPQFRLGLWRATFDTPSYKGHFQPPLEEIFEYKLTGSLDIVTNRVLSKSYIAILPEDDKKKVTARVQEILERGDDKVWIDEKEGLLEYPYKTFVVIAQRRYGG